MARDMLDAVQREGIRVCSLGDFDVYCRGFTPLPMTRRDMLARCANGFGLVAFTGLFAADAPAGRAVAPNFRARARSVIFVYMDGGVSQVDSFDPTPRLHREHGKPFAAKIEPTQFNNI